MKSGGAILLGCTGERSQNSPLIVCFSRMHMSFALPKSANIKAVVSLGQAHALSVRRLNVPLVEGRHLLPDDLSPTGYHDFYVEGSREPIAMLYSKET